MNDSASSKNSSTAPTTPPTRRARRASGEESCWNRQLGVDSLLEACEGSYRAVRRAETSMATSRHKSLVACGGSRPVLPEPRRRGRPASSRRTPRLPRHGRDGRSARIRPAATEVASRTPSSLVGTTLPVLVRDRASVLDVQGVAECLIELDERIEVEPAHWLLHEALRHRDHVVAADDARFG